MKRSQNSTWTGQKKLSSNFEDRLDVSKLWRRKHLLEVMKTNSGHWKCLLIILELFLLWYIPSGSARPSSSLPRRRHLLTLSSISLLSSLHSYYSKVNFRATHAISPLHVSGLAQNYLPDPFIDYRIA